MQVEVSMFATHTSWTHPLQLEPEVIVWRAVEVMFSSQPFLLIQFLDAEGEERVMFIQTSDHLFDLMSSPKGQDVFGVQLVMPPGASPTNDWHFVPVSRVERELKSYDGARLSAVFSDKEGQRYGGFPIDVMTRDEADLELLAELPRSCDDIRRRAGIPSD
jgi:hypothetical protein